MAQAASELTSLLIEHALLNDYRLKGPYDGMHDGRRLNDLDEPAFRTLIVEVGELTIDRIEVTSNVRPGRSDEKWLND